MTGGDEPATTGTIMPNGKKRLLKALVASGGIPVPEINNNRYNTG